MQKTKTGTRPARAARPNSDQSATATARRTRLIDTPIGLARGNGWSDHRAHVDADVYDGNRLTGTRIAAELTVSQSGDRLVSISCTISRGDNDVDAFRPDALRLDEVETVFLAIGALRERARMDGIIPSGGRGVIMTDDLLRSANGPAIIASDK